MESVSVKNIRGHYEIYLDGVFYCSCDVGELTETLSEIEEEVRNETKDKQSSNN